MSILKVLERNDTRFDRYWDEYVKLKRELKPLNNEIKTQANIMDGQATKKKNIQAAYKSPNATPARKAELKKEFEEAKAKYEAAEKKKKEVKAKAAKIGERWTKLQDWLHKYIRKQEDYGKVPDGTTAKFLAGKLDP